MYHLEWGRLAKRVKRESPDLFVDTQDWYVRRGGIGLSCIDPKTGEHFILWSPEDWIARRAERGS